MDARRRALEWLCECDPLRKAEGVRAMRADDLDTHAVLQPATPLPGRPPRPHLAEPTALPRRSPFTPDGRAALLHAVAHIKFNAPKSPIAKIVQCPCVLAPDPGNGTG